MSFSDATHLLDASGGPTPSRLPSDQKPVLTGLSGNEIYCLGKKSLAPGPLVVGNSVMALGAIGSAVASLRTLWGGEVPGVTELIAEGRRRALERMHTEATRVAADGISGVSSELVFLGSNIEFITTGSCVRATTTLASGPPMSGSTSGSKVFSTAGDGQALYCQLDCGFEPRQFVFGNCAYSVGMARAALGGLRSLVRGEVKEYSEAFGRTRHLALERLEQEARGVGANAVLGIQSGILPIWGMQEMVFQGTACYHPSLGGEFIQRPVTSDMTNQEMWNAMNLGLMPIKLVMGVSVYSLGLKGRITSGFKGLVRGEIAEMTELLYAARDSALTRLREQASACGAEDLLGIKTYIFSLGSGLIEMIALGTAVKRMPCAHTLSEELPVQAIIDDQDTFIHATGQSFGTSETGITSKRGNSGLNLLELLLKILGG